MTHTPGPWTIAHGVSNRVYLVNDAKGNAIGETVYADTRNPADARLIAAAPDLLAALRVLKKMAQTTAKTFPNAPGVGDWHQAELVARAAIARATGA